MKESWWVRLMRIPRTRNIITLVFMLAVMLLITTLQRNLPVPPEEEYLSPPLETSVPTPPPPESPETPSSSAQPAPTPAPTPEPTPEPFTAHPVRMKIPALKLDCPVEATQHNEALDTMNIAPDAQIISWYDRSAIPGNPGNAIFGGHNRWSKKNGALLYLDKLEPGDSMTLDFEDGTTRDFILESAHVYYLPTAPSDEIMTLCPAEALPRLTIITCKDPFNKTWGTSANRIVAIFRPAEGYVLPEPRPTPFPTVEPNPAFG